MTDEEKSHVIAGLKDRQRIPDPTVHPAVAGLSPEDPPSLRSYGETGGRGSVQGLFFDSHGRDARATTAE